MVEHRGSLRLALEASQELAVLVRLFGRELWRQRAPKLDVLALRNRTHQAHRSVMGRLDLANS
jgi:hypothetical protein